MARLGAVGRRGRRGLVADSSRDFSSRRAIVPAIVPTFNAEVQAVMISTVIPLIPHRANVI